MKKQSSKVNFEKDFLDHCRDLAEYWANHPDPGRTVEERCLNTVFSVLVAIDGEAADLPGYTLRPLSDTGVEGPNIAGDLHNHFYKEK
jgi:hypothetical protein